MDLVGPVDGKFILTYLDYYSSYPEAYILKEITSREVIKALTDIFARLGCPEELVSDNGKQFISERIRSVSQIAWNKAYSCFSVLCAK